MQYSSPTRHLESHLIRPNDTVNPIRNNVVYWIARKYNKIYIGEMKRPMQQRMEEHERDIRLARTQTFAVSKHANKTGHHPHWSEVKFIDLDSHWYTKRVKEAIYIRFHPDNINRDNGQRETGTIANRRENNLESALSENQNSPEQWGSTSASCFRSS